ncbi:MAG: sulfatase-like hydrolase/transferase, partial [Hungatella sp.]
GLDYFINQEDYEKWADSMGSRTTRSKTELTEVLEDIEGESVSKRYSGHQVSVWDKPLHQFKDFYFRDRSLEFLKQLPKEPFALFTYLWAPHPPLRVPEPYASMYDPEQIVLPDNLGIPAEAEPQLRRKGVPAQLAEGVSLTEWKKVWAAHLGLTTMADEILGQILKELEDQGRLDQTLVIFTADHGDHLGQHGMYQKMEMYEEAIHVPFVIKMPQGKAGRSHGIVSHLDLMPTICEAAGIEAGACDGISLLPIMQGKDPDPDRIVFSQYSGNPGYGTVRRAAISERYKYIFDNQYEHELYDLSKDPHEMKNVAKDPAYTNILKDLYECCQKYHTEHRDCFKWEGENVKV